MKQPPHVSKYIDSEERELIQAIDDDNYAPISVMTPQTLNEHQEAARHTIHEVSTKVSIRIPHYDLMRVKARALKEGLPYQTFIKSIIHQAVSR